MRLITPSKDAVQRHRDKLRDEWDRHKGQPVAAVVAHLSPKIRGWANYYRRVVATATFKSLDYPGFVARQFPIGSGAVESACKGVVEARLKQAGMRWATAGSQAIASLRALQRAGRWAAFWQTQPHTQRVSASPCAAPPHVASPPPPRPVTPATSPSSPRTRPTPTPRQRPLLLPRSA